MDGHLGRGNSQSVNGDNGNIGVSGGGGGYPEYEEKGPETRPKTIVRSKKAGKAEKGASVRARGAAAAANV